jgi:hypothetical protein
MSTLRFRLVCVIALALVGGVVSQSAGASSAGVSDSRAPAAVPQWLGAHHIPLPGRAGLASLSTGASSSALRSAAASSSFTNVGIDFGNTWVYSVTWADYDSDGRPDLLALGLDPPSDNSALPVPVNKLYHSNGDGTFSENTAAGLPSLYDAVASWADYDSDGHLDVLIAGCTDIYCPATASKLYRNNGDGTFSEDTRAGLIGVVTSTDMITWTDYDSDGRPDVLLTGGLGLSIASVGSSSIAVPPTRLYHNNGDGTFSENTSARFPDCNWLMSAWSDYDGDGFPDLLLSGFTGSNGPTRSVPVTKLYHNNRDGTFSENTATQLPGAAGFWMGWISWGDYNGDGYPDILVNGSPEMASDTPAAASTTRLYHNDGDGTFSEDTAAGLPAVDNAQLIWGDYTGDGRLDIALNGCLGSCFENGYVTEIYQNDGDGTFSKDTNAGLPADYAWLASGDYNSDGRLDLLVWATSEPTNTGIYRNNGTAAPTPDSPIRLESHLLRRGVVRLSWQESSSKTRDNSLSYNLRVGTTPGGVDIVSPLAGPNGARQVAAYGNTEGKNFAKLTGLRPGTYYWSVQAVGANYAGSSFSPQHDFVIAPTPTLTLLRTKIFACTAGPRTTKVFGKVSPGYYSAAVALQTRFVDGAGWRAVAVKKLSSPGTFSFAKVGKGIKQSFWLRIRIRSKIGTVMSRSARVIVNDAAACAQPKAGATP